MWCYDCGKDITSANVLIMPFREDDGSWVSKHETYCSDCVSKGTAKRVKLWEQYESEDVTLASIKFMHKWLEGNE